MGNLLSLKSVKTKNNQFPAMKCALRLWLAENFKSPKVLDVYGGHGMMFSNVWEKVSGLYECTSGDALKWLKEQKTLDHDIFDIDPYGSPFEALIEIKKIVTKRRIGIVATDGCLRFCGKIRARLPRGIIDSCGWDWHDKTLMAGIHHQYPKFLRFALEKIMSGWKIEKLAVKSGIGSSCGTSYFAALFVKT
jgi:hypothetical protein